MRLFTGSNVWGGGRRTPLSRSALDGAEASRKNEHVINRVKIFRVINSWNELSEHVVTTPTVNVFKHGLDGYWATKYSAS